MTAKMPVGHKYATENKYVGYFVYAVFDAYGRCAYVGCSRSLKRRLMTHRTGKGHVENLSVLMCENHEIWVFTVADVDKFFELNNGAPPLPYDTNAYSPKAAAEDAETYMCKIMKPYMNQRKTYAIEIGMALDFFRRKILDRDTVMVYVDAALKRYGVSHDRYEDEMSRVETALDLAR